MDFVRTMDMSYSYKPVLLKAIFGHVRVGDNGKVRVCDLVRYFIDFYEERKKRGLIAEKRSSIFERGGYTEKDVERNIFTNPFKRFADMRFLQRCRDLEWVQINRDIFKKLTDEDVKEILKVCDAKLGEYYSRSAFGG